MSARIRPGRDRDPGLRGLTELKVADPDELIDALQAWAATGDGANAAIAAIDDAARAAGTEFGRVLHPHQARPARASLSRRSTPPTRWPRRCPPRRCARFSPRSG
jgi:hypothetical protein